MIFDGRWKNEVKQLSWEITVWQRLSVFGGIAEHRLNRAVLYSATILRKIIEDEVEAESIVKKYNLLLSKRKTVHAVLQSVKYPYTGKDGWAVRSKLCVSDYGKGQEVSVKAKDVCNWLLHSYVWGVALNADRKSFAGFLVASDFDKEKYVHYISFEEWKTLLNSVIDNGTF